MYVIWFLKPLFAMRTVKLINLQQTLWKFYSLSKKMILKQDSKIRWEDWLTFLDANSVGLNPVHGFEVWVNRQFRRIFSDRWAWLQIISDLVLRFGPFLAKEFQSLCFIYIFRFNPNTNPTYIWLINCTLI